MNLPFRDSWRNAKQQRLLLATLKHSRIRHQSDVSDSLRWYLMASNGLVAVLSFLAIAYLIWQLLEAFYPQMLP